MLQEIKSAARGSVLETHPHYRTAIGVLGVLLPILLIISSLVQRQAIRNSISAYYHTSARDWFVGTLWVLGVFLFFYRYRPLHLSTPRSQRESIKTGAADAWLGKIAGVTAVLVALLPTTDAGSPNRPAIIGTAHGVAAAILFICLSLFPLLLFSQSRKRGPFYRVVGWLMIILLSLVAAHAFAPGSIRLALAPLKPVLVIETLLIWAFGISWFEKGRELAADEKSGEIPAEATRRVA
jgi:hypothetical protein